MRKIIESRLFFFILGVLVFSIGTAFAYSYIAEQVEYESNDLDWEVDNVQDALDSLRQNNNRLGILVKEITTGGTSYTMQNNGYILGTIRPSYGYAGAQIHFNSTDESNYESVVALGEYDLNYDFPVSLFAPAGTLVYTRSLGNYDLKIYEWK